MTVIKIVPMPGEGVEGPQGPAGQDGTSPTISIGDVITVDYESLAEVYNSGTSTDAIFNFVIPSGPQGEPGTSGSTIIPLPNFLSYEEGRAALPTLNTNFGWDSNGVWFGGTAVDNQADASYPIFSAFTLSDTDNVRIIFNVAINDGCSDVGLCVYPADGTVPEWSWDPNTTRIAAQFDCPQPMILGQAAAAGPVDPLISLDPGLYGLSFEYNPIEGTTIFSVYQNEVEISTMTLSGETLPVGNGYKIGFTADQDTPWLRTYISDLNIWVNDEPLYSDTLTNGDSGSSNTTGDFIFQNQMMFTVDKNPAIRSIQLQDETSGELSISADHNLYLESNTGTLITSGQKIILAGNGLNSEDAGNEVYLGSDSDIDNRLVSRAMLYAQGSDLTTALTPTEQSYAVQGGTTGAVQPQFNGDPLFSASYIQNGDLLFFRINVLMTNILDFGIGQYYMTLPFASKYDVVFRDGHIVDSSSGKTYGISAHAEANSNTMILSYTASTGRDEEFTSTSPITLTTADHFQISGTYIPQVV